MIKKLSKNNFGRKALLDLGVKKFEFYNLKCGKLNSYPITEIAKIIENEIKDFKPDVVLTHSDNDVNLDLEQFFKHHYNQQDQRTKVK